MNRIFINIKLIIYYAGLLIFCIFLFNDCIDWVKDDGKPTKDKPAAKCGRGFDGCTETSSTSSMTLPTETEINE